MKEVAGGRWERTLIYASISAITILNCSWSRMQAHEKISINLGQPQLNLVSGLPYIANLSFADHTPANLFQRLTAESYGAPSTTHVQLGASKPESEASGVQGGESPKPEIGKKLLALSILGTLPTAVGALAIAERSHSHYCSYGTDAQQVCSDVRTGGEIMLPVGVAVAATGFFFAFRHH